VLECGNRKCLKVDQVNRKFKMFVGGVKMALASQRYQPNRELTAKFLLTSDEMPGNGWNEPAKLDVPTYTFYKNARPEIERAKLMKGTTSRALFKDASDSIIVEVTPFADATDADSWVSSADDRIKRRMAEWIDPNEFQVINDVSVPGGAVSCGMKYSLTRPEGKRSRLVIATSIDNVYVLVTCINDDQRWKLEDVVEIAGVQVEKIRALNRSLKE
jgi:hypothetical protein